MKELELLYRKIRKNKTKEDFIKFIELLKDVEDKIDDNIFKHPFKSFILKFVFEWVMYKVSDIYGVDIYFVKFAYNKYKQKGKDELIKIVNNKCNCKGDK